MPKAYNPHDKLMIKAKFQGFRARSVYKLQELDEKFKLLKPGMKVLDVGAAPGSWLQYTSLKIGAQGKVLGIDLQEIQPVESNVVTEVVDINDLDTVRQKLDQHQLNLVDLVLSDIAPNTTGIKGLDNQKSLELSQSVFEVSNLCLKRSGALVMKIFDGENLGKFMNKLRDTFGFVTAFKVRASRDRSREVYVVCQRKKSDPINLTHENTT